jgi:hypothetical protein
MTFFPPFSRSQKMMGQVLRHQKFFMRQWAWCIRKSEGGPIPKVTDIRNHSNKFIPTFLDATEDDGPSVETPGIFYETVSLVHLVVRGG